MRIALSILSLLFALQSLAQKTDSTNKSWPLILGSEALIYTGTTIGLNQVWYTNFERSKFHTFNDNAEWMQMDKAGHFMASQAIANTQYAFMKIGNMPDNKAITISFATSLLTTTTIEILDAYSSKWGFSWGDMLANISGASLFAMQQKYWKEQKILTKFSAQLTPFAERNPTLLGHSKAERILKDYNGQTYWLSISPGSFGNSKLPKWVGIAGGYGANGLLSARSPYVYPENAEIALQSHRQYYLSLDVHFDKIKTNSQFLKNTFKILSFIKVPLPTYEVNPGYSNKFYWLFF